MTFFDQPSGVAKQIDVLAVTDAIAGSRSVAMELPFVDHFAERCAD